jgi:hypothetical protein
MHQRDVVGMGDAGSDRPTQEFVVGDRQRLVFSQPKVLTPSQEGCTIREIAEEMGVLHCSQYSSDFEGLSPHLS